jgi:hypothetical protein
MATLIFPHIVVNELYDCGIAVVNVTETPKDALLTLTEKGNVKFQTSVTIKANDCYLEFIEKFISKTPSAILKIEAGDGVTSTMIRYHKENGKKIPFSEIHPEKFTI